MGLALHKDLAEVRAMPYRDWYAWRLYDLLEPIGWPNEEFHFATLLAMIFNANRGKGKAKDAKDFMRDTLKSVIEALKKQPDISEMTKEQIIVLVKKDFGLV